MLWGGQNRKLQSKRKIKSFCPQALFQDKEMDILDVNVMRYLRYPTDNADYLKRLFEMHIGSSEKETEYLLFSVQVTKIRVFMERGRTFFF